MRLRSMIYILALGILLIPRANGKNQTKPQTKYNIISKAEDTRRNKKLAILELKSRKAQELISKRKFEAAKAILERIESAYNTLGSSQYIKTKLDKLYKIEAQLYLNWGRYIITMVNDAYKAHQWSKGIKLTDKALVKLHKAKKLDPSLDINIKEIMTRRNKASSKIKEEIFRSRVGTKEIKKTAEKTKYELTKLLQQAEVLVKEKKYMMARKKLEEVLTVDPYNFKAMKLLKHVYSKLFHVAESRKQYELIERMSEVEWAYSENILSDADKNEALNTTKALKSTDFKIYDKLKSIRIEKIDFEEAPLPSVLSYLKRESKRLDKTDNIGISIVLRIDKEKESTLNKITMSLDDIPIGEVIKYVCLAANLKYRVEEHAIIIGDSSINEMSTRFFQVSVNLMNSISSVSQNTSLEDAEDLEIDLETFGTEIEQEEAIVNQVTPEKIKSYFEERGIPFPEGAQIAWDKRTGKLIATNTPSNLRKISTLLKEIDIAPPLVLIETKFVEITETDLEELGFDWRIAANNVSSSNGKTWYLNHFNASRTGGTTDQNYNDSILRHYYTGTAPSSLSSYTGGLINNLTANPSTLSGILSTTEVNFWLYALDQSGVAEILSSPKVIATSGSPALIRMVREEYFPLSWAEPEIAIASNGISYVPSYPDFGSPTDIGIRLEVTPTVSPNNYTIMLDLHPEVVSFTDWSDYSYEILLGTLGLQSSSYKVTLKMPEISTRDITTTVKINDGETIVLGGMLQDSSAGTDDRVPGAGEIPLLGRLFRSKYKNDVKKNLLIFVTARLIKANGVPIRKNSHTGLIDLKR